MRLDFQTKMLVNYKEATIDGSDQLALISAICGWQIIDFDDFHFISNKNQKNFL